LFHYVVTFVSATLALILQLGQTQGLEGLEKKVADETSQCLRKKKEDKYQVQSLRSSKRFEWGKIDFYKKKELELE